MITFVYGGSGSGKSEYAEGIVLSYSESSERYYIATMMAYGEEGEARVQRHRRLRAGKGFVTVECPVNIERALEKTAHSRRGTVLLECIPNLAANEMFDSPSGEKGITDRIVDGVSCLAAECENLIIVSDNVFEDGTDYDCVTVRYMKYLGEINKRLAALADSVIEVAAGLVIKVK